MKIAIHKIILIMAHLVRIKAELDAAKISELKYKNITLNKNGTFMINNKIIATNGKIDTSGLQPDEISFIKKLDIIKLKLELDITIKETRKRVKKQITSLVGFYATLCKELDELKTLCEYSNINKLIISIYSKTHVEIDILEDEIKILDNQLTLTTLNKKTNFDIMDERQINLIYTSVESVKEYVLKCI